VEKPGGDQFVSVAVATQQPAHLDRMNDERRLVDLSILVGMA
jgi:hypothetical protein